MFALIADHAARAVARLLTQFKPSAEVQGITNVFAAEIQALEDAIFECLVVRDLDNAEGATLDSIGHMVAAEPRGTYSDVEYRKRVRAQIRVNKSSGTPADFIAITLALVPEWDGIVKTREGGPTSAGYLAGDPTGQLTHSGAIEIVCVPDTVASGITAARARELARYLKKAAAGGVRPILVYRNISILANTAFRFGGGTPPETAVGFGVGKIFNALDH